MKNNIKTKTPTTMEVIETLLSDTGFTVNNLLTIIKVIALTEYCGMSSAEETYCIKEFEFTVKNNFIVGFEFWTNSARTEGYKYIDLSELEINFYELMSVLN
jgi:hypothetical protein